ncbi:TIGR03620 family F420-dependent LLM class oxidoreductase [Nocardia sp. BMG51109]|uniref:TIGR03620 family F420-dependent LLM class oxidoreductase n=1 Tax=Nocardia sp. BMG51109 TaxID=1056816 RepID=UPI000463F018|nr:TIGR03620 family F420-dependent LLM class oxidoreductase [Nocardia sp. BMG51109]
MTTVTEARRRLGRIGVWLNNAITATAPADDQRRALVRIEQLGYGSAWTGESTGGRDIFAKLGVWLAATDRLVIGSGVANMWARPGITMAAGAATLAEAYPQRFVLGVGVGFPRQAESVGRSYGRPLARMREYLDEMDTRPEAALTPAASRAETPYPRVLAAVGPKMLALAGERADGAHPYAAPVATTARARAILGPGKLVIPEQLVIYDPDPAQAREQARAYRAQSLSALQVIGGAAGSPYGRNLIRLGYTEEQVSTVDDTVIDAIIAHGDESAIAERLHEHLSAGADHVLINPVAPDLPATVDILERLAPAVLDV